jgi:putative endonuclease
LAEAARLKAYAFGRRAEDLAVLALRLKGYRVLARRVRLAGGEIDIVARRGATLAFVEVKARPSRDAALMALTPAQRRRQERAARAWLAGRPALLARARTLRFDLVLVAPWRWPRHLADAWHNDPDSTGRAGMA